MGYVPVQRDAGQIMYQGAMQRARTLGQTARDITDFLYQKDEENKAFGSKLKSLESLLQTHSDKFGIKEDQLKQFLSVNPNESPKERYLRLGNFIEGSIQAAQLEKINLANRKAQMDLEQMKKLGDIYATIQNEDTQKPKDQNIQDQQGAQRRFRRIDSSAPESTLQRGTGEMSLLNSLKTFGGPALQGGGQSMIGAEPFSYELPPSVTPNPVSAALPAPDKQEPRALGSLTATGEAVPPPPLPSWFNAESEPQLGMDLNLSPEAKSIARQLREEYEASQPSDGGREPARFLSATSDGTPPKRKTITLDAEGIKAILSNPKILVESFADVAGDPYQQGLRRERLDRMMREQEQLRALEQMMRQTRRGR